MHHDPFWYTGLSLLGVVPLYCGPRVYRWFGGIFVIGALVFAVQEYRARVAQQAFLAELRAEAEAGEKGR